MTRYTFWTGAVVAAAIGVTALVFGPWGASASESDSLLVVDAAGTVQLIDTASGEARFRVDDAVVSQDRSSLFNTREGVASTHIESRDPRTGAVTGVTTVAADLEIRAVSPLAGAIALAEERPDDLGLYEPIPRERTSITVAYTDESPSRTFDLEGNYEVETFSYDESVLYLLEFQPPLEPTYYIVRELDLETGLVDGVKTPQVELQPEMRGIARAQQVDPDGRRLYTLYSIPGDEAPVHDVTDAEDSERWAFVHVLDLELGIDICIFLPAPMGERAEQTVGLGLSPDGSTLWVVDPSTSHAARIDTETLEITDIHVLPELNGDFERAKVAVADDGTLYVALGPAIHAFDPATLERSAVWVSRNDSAHAVDVDDIAVSSNNALLQFVAGGRIVLISRETGLELAQLRGPNGEELRILGPPTGAATQIPLECAC